MIKKKILWVVYDFVQAGGQRYVYEICKALDKEKYQVDILKVDAMGRDKDWDEEYYFQPSLALGCNIYFLADLLQKNTTVPAALWQRGLLFITRKLKINTAYATASAAAAKDASIIEGFLNKYDHINFSGLNVYRSLCLSNGFEPSHGIIHILTAQFQDDRSLFANYTKTFRYHFVSSIAQENLKEELAGIDHYTYTDFPLCFKTDSYEVNHTYAGIKTYRIAVFTRLSVMKPLDIYFYALKLLLESGLDVELQVYGAGNPELLGIVRQLNYLYIADHVHFMGHAQDIPETIKHADIDVIWFQSNNQLPAGYAALEIAMSGLPQVFWDFMNNGVQEALAAIYPCFTNLTAFTNYTEKLLLSKQDRLQLGLKQRDYIKKHHSIENNISMLEKIYDV